MKILAVTALSAALTAGVAINGTSPVQAQSCNYFAGKAVGGQSLNVDLCSISRASAQSVDFVYYLGSDRIQSQANCAAGTWTTFPEKAVHRPQSQATQNMLNAVCSGRASNPPSRKNVATVFDPPSNVRISPNGSVLCTVKARTSINLYGSTGSWYYTDVCGQMGVIHSSQLRF